MKTLLAPLTSADVIETPFPHLLVRNAVSSELANKLLETFPSVETVTKGEDPGDNKRFDFIIKDIRGEPIISPVWREFIEAQASVEFQQDVFRIFGKWIDRFYPDLKKQFGSYENIRHGIRYVDSHKNADLLFDAHISINTPVLKRATSVRTAHVDDPRKLCSGLLYLRQPEDDSRGGELVLYKMKPGVRRRMEGQYVDENQVEEIKRVPYEKNTFVFFLNTLDSIHGVTPRHPTHHPRTFVNLVGEFEHPLFNIKQYQPSRITRYLRRLVGVKTPKTYA